MTAAQTGPDAGRVFIEGGSLEAVNDYFLAQGWSDGLPVVPPVPERVATFVKAAGREGEAVIGRVPPRWGRATVEKIAINAVMGGCRPEYMPALLSIVEGVCREDFDLAAVQATTHPCGVLSIFHGPIRKELNVNCAAGIFGPGWQANATIGRALRLVLMNIGGGLPGNGDQSTQGHPCKYTYCIGENEEESPWGPYHADVGYRPTDSAVTLVAADSPRNMLERSSTSGASLLVSLANACVAYGSNNAVLGRSSLVAVLAPEHAQLLARDGYSKRDVGDYLWERARVEFDRFPPEVRQTRMEHDRSLGRPVPASGDRLRLAHRREDVYIFVAGGAGKHSSIIATPSLAAVHTVPVPMK